jgi:hypothetical protein
MTDRRPIPTEYKGVRFRSKSEAVFARTLDLVVGRNLTWTYEPKGHKGHPWDFEIQLDIPEYNGRQTQRRKLLF